MSVAAAAIMGGIGLAGSVFGGIGAAKQRRKMDKYLSQQEAENQSWYNANALGDYTQRTDTQALLGNMRESLKRQNKAAANSAVVTGATPELQAAQKEQSTQAIADTYSNLGAMGQQWKDNISDRYMARKNELVGMRYNNAAAKANSYENLMSNGLNMVASAPQMLMGSSLDKKK